MQESFKQLSIEEQRQFQLQQSHVDVDIAAGAKGLKDSFWAGGFSFCLCQELSFNINFTCLWLY